MSPSVGFSTDRSSIPSLNHHLRSSLVPRTPPSRWWFLTLSLSRGTCSTGPTDAFPAIWVHRDPSRTRNPFLRWGLSTCTHTPAGGDGRRDRPSALRTLGNFRRSTLDQRDPSSSLCHVHPVPTLYRFPGVLFISKRTEVGGRTRSPPVCSRTGSDGPEPFPTEHLNPDSKRPGTLTRHLVREEDPGGGSTSLESSPVFATLVRTDRG